VFVLYENLLLYFDISFNFLFPETSAISITIVARIDAPKYTKKVIRSQGFMGIYFV